MKKLVFLMIIFLIFLIFLSCSKEEDKVGKEFEDKMSNLLSQIVVELKEPKKITLTPRRFVELSAIMIASNYYWAKELISSNSNVSTEEIVNYRLLKKQQLLSLFGLTVDEYENYSINNYKDLQKFSKQNPEIMKLYNEIARSLPTFEE